MPQPNGNAVWSPVSGYGFKADGGTTAVAGGVRYQRTSNPNVPACVLNPFRRRVS